MQTAECVQGEMAIMGPEGDTKVIWNSGNADEVESAKETFRRLKAKGYIAYSVTEAGEKATAIQNFDPMLQKIILSPPVIGG